jgi:hypothetical protein
MATAQRIAVRTQKQVETIMEAVENLAAKVEASSRPAELTATFKDGAVLDSIKADIADLKEMQAEICVILNKMRADVAESKPKRRGRKPKPIDVPEE